MIISAFFRVYSQKATGVTVSKSRGEDKMTNNITQTDDVLIKPVVLNYTVKDFDGNFEKIETAYKEAVEEGVDLVVTTEMSLSGYPLEDAVENDDVLEAAQVSLRRAIEMTKGNDTALIVGLPERQEDGRILNKSVVLQNGEIIGVSEKKHRPNYGVFDEKRNFASGTRNDIFEIKGKRFGIAICEDTWFEDVSKDLKDKGAEMLISVNASPFEIGKQKRRMTDVIEERVWETKLPMLYVNQYGAQDELIFDGGAVYCEMRYSKGCSGIVAQIAGRNSALGEMNRYEIFPRMSEGGAILKIERESGDASGRLKVPSFSDYKKLHADKPVKSVKSDDPSDLLEDVINEASEPAFKDYVSGFDTVQRSVKATPRVADETIPDEFKELWEDVYAKLEQAELDELGDVYNALVLAVRDYTRKTGHTSVCLGMSGGVDSALVAAIAVDALGAENVKLYSMPSKFTSDMSNSLAYDMADRIGASIETMEIQGIVDQFIAALDPRCPNGIERLTIENLQARTRGTLLMGISNNTPGMMVLSTGNKSENAIGYATLYGDMNGGYNPLKDVLKTRVFKLCHWRNRNIPVTAKLQKTDIIPEGIIFRPPSAELFEGQVDTDSLPPYEVLDDIIERYAEKELMISKISEMIDLSEEFVTEWATKIDISQYKRDQSCPGPKIATRDFERDRRYPNSAKTIGAVTRYIKKYSVA